MNWHEVPGLLPFALLLGIMALQLIPLPQPLLSVLSPKALQAYRETLGVVAGDGFWAPLTLDRRATFIELTRYASYFLFYMISIQLMCSRKILKRAGRFVVVAAALVAFISILNKFSSGDMILWLREVPPGSTFFGPFVNKNHYAAYMGMVFPLGVGLFLTYRPHISGLGLMDALKATAGYKRIHTHFIFAFASLLIATSVFVSLSRAGLVSLCISMVLMAVLLGRKNLGRNLAMGILFLTIAVLVGWFGWDPIIDRFGSIVDQEGSLQFNRAFIWTDAIRIIKDFPILGTGFGSFESIYPSYRTLPGRLVVDHAHNDFLELMVEGGLISFALAAWFVLSVLIRVLGAIRVRRENYSIIMAIAGASAMIYMLVHAFVDFNMHIGSNALYFFFVAAFAVSASHTRLRKGSRSSLLKSQPLANKKVLLYTVLLASVFIILVNVLLMLGALVSRGHGSVAHDSGSSIEELEQARKSYTLAMYLDPFNSGYRADLARAGMALGGTGLKEYIDAIKYLPLDARILQGAARAFGYAGNDSKADALMRASLIYGARHNDPHLLYVQWLLLKGSYIRAEEVARKEIQLEPAQTKGYARIFIKAGFSGPEVLGVLPDRSAAHVRLARYFMEQDMKYLADDTYWRALDLMADEDSLTRMDYALMFRHFSGKGRFDAARAVAEDAVENFPEQSRFRVWLGSAHERTGDVDSARKEYEKALSLDPANADIVRRLERLSRKSRGNVVK